MRSHHIHPDSDDPARPTGRGRARDGLPGRGPGGPRGGGRDRDVIVRHTVRTESEDFAKKVGLQIPERAVLERKALLAYRKDYLQAIRAYNAGEIKRMRSWNLPFLIRHSAFHTMDHAWEMQDKDLTASAI